MKNAVKEVPCSSADLTNAILNGMRPGGRFLFSALMASFELNERAVDLADYCCSRMSRRMLRLCCCIFCCSYRMMRGHVRSPGFEPMKVRVAEPAYLDADAQDNKDADEREEGYADHRVPSQKRMLKVP
jgi:hypothetical protein